MQKEEETELLKETDFPVRTSTKAIDKNKVCTGIKTLQSLLFIPYCVAWPTVWILQGLINGSGDHERGRWSE